VPRRSTHILDVVGADTLLGRIVARFGGAINVKIGFKWQHSTIDSTGGVFWHEGRWAGFFNAPLWAAKSRNFWRIRFTAECWTKKAWVFKVFGALKTRLDFELSCHERLSSVLHFLSFVAILPIFCGW